MNRLATAVGSAVLVASLLSACTDTMPMIRPSKPASQLKLSSARQWEMISEHVSRGLRAGLDDLLDDECLSIVTASTAGGSPFQSFLTDAVTHYILNTERAKPKGNVRRLAIYPFVPLNRECARVQLRTMVVTHNGPVARPYPGQYTLLAKGIMVIKHVASEFTGTRFVGSVAAGELGFWAASGFSPGDTFVEVTITTSLSGSDRSLVSDDTDVYYIASGDVDLYKAKPLVASVNTSAYGAAGNSSSPNTLALDLDGGESKSAVHPRPRRLQAQPDTISACDKTPQFVVGGKYMATDAASYQLGAHPASGFAGSGPPADGSEEFQTVQVKFDLTKSTLPAADQLVLSMAGTDGLPGIARINIEGDSKACAPPAKSVEPLQDLKLVQTSPSASNMFEVCAARWTVLATGTSTREVTEAQIPAAGIKVKLKPSTSATGLPIAFPALTPQQVKVPAGKSSVKLTIDVVDGMDDTKTTPLKHAFPIDVTCTTGNSQTSAAAVRKQNGQSVPAPPAAASSNPNSPGSATPPAQDTAGSH